jgi:carboxylesterase
MIKKLIPGSEPVYFEGNSTGILFIHGFTSSPYEMKPLSKYLKKHKYTLSIPLLKGHGTDPSDLIGCRWYDWFEEVKEILFEMRKNCKTIVVVGLSTGATLALHLAAHYQIEGVVALAPALILKEKKLKLLPLASFFKKYQNKRNGPDISDDEAKKNAVTYDKTPLKTVKELLNLYSHVKIDLPDIYTPVLIIHSSRDHVADIKGAEYIYDHIKSSDKNFLKLEKSYHVLTLDVEKEIVFRETAGFIGRISRQKS